MSTVTRRALRVYSALAGLRATNEDILDALIPFLEPVLEVMNGKIFDPNLLTAGVRRLYRWRFTRDIAEQFIPRLQKKGYLHRRGEARTGIYFVTYQTPNDTNDISLTEILEQIIDRFEEFPARITDLLNYSRTRDELTDMLIRFLVSIDAYRDSSFTAGLDRLQLEAGSQPLLKQLEEGGSPLAPDDRYMCARFVKELCATEPVFIPHLTKLASIGLLTEVVEDFIRPVQPAEKVDLTIAIDAPLALDLLGCSGIALQEDTKSIFDALRAIGCSLIVFPITCEEITRNLKSMLALPAPKRHGYTHEAVLRGEVMLDYVVSVANDPQKALERVGVQVRSMDRRLYPASHIYFDAERYEDFFSSVYWVAEVPPREHDATCLTLVMRLRAGQHSSDIFRCGYVLVTRNSTFVRESRAYCLQSRLINQIQEGPVIHQRELATIAWLRTGLGANDRIPRGHLLATCERVLRVRPELTAAVGLKLKEVTPDKLEQYELLLQDYRSVRKLADETLNDEAVVTAENAQRLLEVMKRATVAEEREDFERKLQEQRSRHKQEKAVIKAKANEVIAQREAERVLIEGQLTATITDRDAAMEVIQRRLIADNEGLARLVERQNRRFKISERVIGAFLVLMGVFAIVEYSTGWLTHSSWWVALLAIAGLLGLYHFVTDLLEVRKIGLASILSYISRKMIEQKVVKYRLQDVWRSKGVTINAGQIKMME